MSLSSLSYTEHHGQSKSISAQDKTREQERQSPEKAWGQVCDGEGNTEQREKSRTGKRSRQRIVTVENAVEMKKSFVVVAATTEEIEEAIQDRCTTFCHPSIGFAFSTSRYGTINHSYFLHDIPENVEDIYVRLYLKTHTGFK